MRAFQTTYVGRHDFPKHLPDLIHARVMCGKTNYRHPDSSEIVASPAPARRLGIEARYCVGDVAIDR
jgi:hypothetical protein